MSSKLAFPGWSMGQVLLPEQFRALQETMLAHVDARAMLTGLPGYGLARLQWSEDLIPTGAISVDALTYVFRSGLLIDVPGNAIITDYNLKDVKVDQVSLYLHVHNQTRDASGIKQYIDDDHSVTRVIYRAELSPEPRIDDARESEKLAELERRDGSWVLGKYSPPVLRLGYGASVFLREDLDRIQKEIERLESQLAMRNAESALGVDQLSELRRVRASAYHALGILADLGVGDGQQEVSQHPYTLFAALRDFYVEISILQGIAPEGWPIRYLHDDLQLCFSGLTERISRYIGKSRLVQPELDFERSGDWYVTGRFPEALVRATDVHLIVKPGTSGTVDMGGVKLASPRRIEEVYTRALAGVQLVPLRSQNLSRIYGQDAVFYTVQTKDDEEWACAVLEEALCFPAWPELEGIRAALVWGA